MRRHTRLAAASALTLCLTLAACGGAGGAGGGEQIKGEGSGESCKIDGKVPVGAAFSLTGAAAPYGDTQKKGLELAAKTLNAKGGVTYDVKIEDDQTDPKRGISVFESFVDSGVSVIVGPTLSNAAKQTDPIAQEGKLPVLGISNTAGGITEIGDYIWRDSLTETAVIPQVVKTAKEKMNIKKVVVMYSNDDAFTESGFQAFKGALESEGVQILDTITFSKTDTDFRSVLTQAKGKRPDALVVSGLVEAAIPLVTQAREDIGITVPIIGGNGFNSPRLMKDAGKAAEGVVVGAAWNSASQSARNAEFVKAYTAAYGEGPDQFAAQAYAGLEIVDAAVRANCAGGRDDIKAGFAKVKDLETVLGTFSFDDKRDAVHAPVVQVVKSGKFDVLK